MPDELFHAVHSHNSAPDIILKYYTANEVPKMKIHESAENYLEAILIISLRQAHVRSIDIANELEVSKPSVSVAMKNLRENGYIHMGSEGYITLTESGQKIADTMYERHTLLSQWLIHLGVPEEVAVSDACKMEHVLSPETFLAIKNHVKN